MPRLRLVGQLAFGAMYLIFGTLVLAALGGQINATIVWLLVVVMWLGAIASVVAAIGFNLGAITVSAIYVWVGVMLVVHFGGPAKGLVPWELFWAVFVCLGCCIAVEKILHRAGMRGLWGR